MLVWLRRKVIFSDAQVARGAEATSTAMNLPISSNHKILRLQFLYRFGR